MSPKVDPEATTGCPSVIQPFLMECLDRGRMAVVVLDERKRVGWANQSFWEAVREGRPARGIPFQELLEPESVEIFSHLEPFAPNEVKILELRHPIPVGAIVISYQFFPCADGSICGIGSDRTEEKELIDQMSALIEDLHREMARRSELSRRLEEMAVTDFLTNLSNRRHFDDTLKREWGRMRRYGFHFALLILDIDRFKEVNDRFGHQTGDEVLKRIAEILKAEVRAEDVVARYGGEEFAVIALNAKMRQAYDLAERLRRRIAAAPMPAGVWGLTISIGATGTADLDPQVRMSDLVAWADKALYLAKERGRNRVEVLPEVSEGAG